MWDLYLTKAEAQAAADKMTGNMKLPLGLLDVTRRWDVPIVTGDSKWAITTPGDVAILVGVTRGTSTVKPTWRADAGVGGK